MGRPAAEVGGVCFCPASCPHDMPVAVTGRHRCRAAVEEGIAPISLGELDRTIDGVGMSSPLAELLLLNVRQDSSDGRVTRLPAPHPCMVLHPVAGFSIREGSGTPAGQGARRRRRPSPGRAGALRRS
jgi:hypothetical protein